jgi:hypothetical protein
VRLVLSMIVRVRIYALSQTALRKRGPFGAD